MKRRGLPKYCSEFQDRHGKWRVRARRKGLPTHYFKVMPSGDEFWSEYREWLNGAANPGAGAARTIPGSVSDVIARYYRSTEWMGLADTTKKMMRNIFENFRKEHGNKSFAKLERKHIQAMIAVKPPAAGRNFLKAVRALSRLALDCGIRRDNPTVGVRTVRNKTDGFHSWSEDEIAKFEATHPIGTRARLAFALLLYTGQRRSDVITMGWQLMRGGRLQVKQAKTGVALSIPIHPTLKSILDATPKHNMTFLINRFGKPFTSAGFGNWFREKCDEAGLPQCSAHGLRKACARRLAEAGCSANQIAAVTGHASLREVAHYTRAADQARLADAAIALVAGTNPERNLANLTDRLAKSEVK